MKTMGVPAGLSNYTGDGRQESGDGIRGTGAGERALLKSRSSNLGARMCEKEYGIRIPDYGS